MAISVIGGPFLRCPYHKSRSTLASKLGRLLFGNSHIVGCPEQISEDC